MSNFRRTKSGAVKAIGRAMKEIETEFGLTSDTVANYTTKFRVNKDAPVNTRNALNYDHELINDILEAHYNMDEFKVEKRSIKTDKDIVKRFILEGNQSKIIISDIDGDLKVKFDNKPRKVKFQGKETMYTPYTLLEKIDNTTSSSERIVKAFKAIEEDEGDGWVASRAGLSDEVKDAWVKYQNDEITKKEFEDIANRDQDDIYDLLQGGYKDSKKVSKKAKGGKKR